MSIKITLINHASVKIEIGNIKLLMDPWFSGTCFEGGWGLKYNNLNALEEVRDCTHLWISHFHTDHFHVPTLKEVLKVNPDIKVIGNHSYNFKLDEVIQKVGFKNIIPFLERTWYKLNDDVMIKRYPTTGIDNMLVIETPGGTILNFNDCNLPPSARRNVAKKIGKVDVFFSNYNHAGKLIEYPSRTDEEIMADLTNNYQLNYESFNPTHLIPFASFHYYRASENLYQNNSLIQATDIAKINDRVVPVETGDTAIFDDDFSTYKLIKNNSYVQPTTKTVELRTRNYNIDELKAQGVIYSKKIKKQFPLVVKLVPKINILISDLNLKIGLDLNKGCELLDDANPVHIISHSESLFKWWSKPYGTDSFIVGSHFEITENPIPLKWQSLLGLMVENKVDMVSLAKMPFSINGIKFLLNRREEIWSIIRKGKLEASAQR